jgi:hypothetical protein
MILDELGYIPLDQHGAGPLVSTALDGRSARLKNVIFFTLCANLCF